MGKKRKQMQKRGFRSKSKQTGIIHDEIVGILQARLIKGGNYSHLEKNKKYSRNKREGEVDVLTYSDITGNWHFYEVKYSDRVVCLQKAISQYQRYCAAYPNRVVKGIVVTSQHVYLIGDKSLTKNNIADVIKRKDNARADYFPGSDGWLEDLADQANTLWD